MSAPCRPCGEGWGLCHLRRIGIRAPVPGIADVIHFCKTVTLLGRKREVVDYFLSHAAAPNEGDYISRIHARVIWTNNTYELVDSSLTGVYVNDIRISGKVALQEGDTVTFGKPSGSSIIPGVRVRQPNSPFYFLFEHCHCSTDQVQSLYGERNLSPELLAPASAETSPPVTLSLRFVKNVAPPGTAPSLASAVSAVPPAASSLPTSSLSVTLLSPEALSRTRLAALPFSALGDWPASRHLRSASPDYTVLGEESSLVAPESSPQRTLETARPFLLQGAPESNESKSLGDSKEQGAGCGPDSLQLFPCENVKSDAGTGPAHGCPLLPAPACPEDSAAADHADSQSERRVHTAGLSKGLLQLTPDGEDPDSKLSTSSTEALDSGDSDPEDETIEVNPSAEETAEYGMSWVPESDAQVQVTKEAASGAQVTSASRMERGSPAEEHEPSFMGEPLSEGSTLEADAPEDVSNNLAIDMWPFLPATLGKACRGAASRTAGGASSGEKPELAGQEELGSEGARATSPPKNPARGMPSADDDCEMSSCDSVSDSEGDVEMGPLAKTGSLAVGCRGGAEGFAALEPEMGSVDPEAVNGVGRGAGEPSCAEVGAQMEWAKGRGSATEAAASALDGHEGSSTHVAKEASRQQLSEASPRGFPADDHSEGGECSKQGEKDPAASCAATQETPSSEDQPETCAEERALVAASPPCDPVCTTEPIPKELPGAPIPVAGRHSQSSMAPFGRKGGEMDAEAEERLEGASPGCAGTDTSLENHVADSTLGAAEEMAEDDGPSLGAASALAAGSLRGEQQQPQPSSQSGSEGTCREEGDTEDPSGEGEMEMKAGTCSPVAATGGDAGDQKQQDEKGLLERELSPAAAQESVSWVSTDGALPARGLEGNVALSSVDLAGSTARPLSPFRFPGDDPGEEGGGILCSRDWPWAGPQSSSQTSTKEVRGRVEAGSHRGGPEGEGPASLEDGSLGEAEGCSAAPLVEASVDKAEMDSKYDGAQVGRLDGCQGPHGPSFDRSALLECQLECPVPLGQQKPASPGAEPDGVRPQGPDVGEEWLHSADSPALEEACGPGAAALEPPSPLGPERHHKEIALPEEKDEGDGFGQTPERSPCSEGKGRLLLDTLSAVFEKPGAPKRSAAGNLPRDARTDSAEVPEFCSSDELNLRISDSEAEQEKHNSAGLFGASSRSNLWGGRDALLSDPGAHLVGVAENSKACGKLTEESNPNPAPCDAVIREVSPGRSEGREMQRTGLGGKTASRDESPGGHHDDVIGRPQACNAEMVVAEKSPLLVKTSAAGEQEDQADVGTELVPINLACLPVGSPCLPQCEAKVGVEAPAPDRADGLAENTHLDLAQDDDWLMDDSFSSQPEVKTFAAPLEVGKTIEEHPESEMPTSLCSGKDECAQEMEVNAPDRLGRGMLQRQGNSRQLKDDQDSSAEWSEEGLDCPEYHRTLLQKEEELKGCSSRKRHFHEDEVLRISGVEDPCCFQKRFCPLDSALVQGSAPDLLAPTVMTPPVPLESEEHRDQFGRTIEKFLDQHSNQMTPHLDEGEQKNRGIIAQIVKNYFKKPLCSSKPAIENEKGGTLALSPEAETNEDVDCRSPSILERGGNASCDDLRSPEDQVQDASLDGQRLSASASLSGSPSQEQGEDSAHSTPDSVWEAYFSEEDHFQLSVCSALRNAPSGSPGSSPNAEHVPVPGEKSLDSILSDTSNSSEGSDHWEPLPTQRRSAIASSGVGSQGLPAGASSMAGKAAEVSVVSGVPCEASEVDWRDKDPRTPSDKVASSCKSAQVAASHPRPASDCPGECAARGFQSVGGPPGWDGGGEAPSVEDSEWGRPCVTSTAGEEKAGDGLSKMQTEERTFLQRRQAGFPSQEEAWEPAVGAGEDGSPPQSGLAPGPSLCRAERPFLLNSPSSSAGDGSAKADGGAVGGFQSTEGDPSLFPLPSSEAGGPAGMADNAERGNVGDENGLCRHGSVTGFAGQADSSNGSRRAPGDTGAFVTEPAAGVCGLPAPACSLSGSKCSAVAWSRVAGGAPSVSRSFKEEKDWCDSQDQFAGPSHCMAGSPGISAFHKPHVPKTLAPRCPGSSAGPVDFGSGDEALLPDPLEEAKEPPGQLASGEDPAPCSAASPGLEEGTSSGSREQCQASSAPARSTGHPAAAGTESSVAVKGWASSSAQDVAFQLQQCQALLGEISRCLDVVEGIDSLHMEKWRNQIAVIQKATKMPQTYIAVVGNMGSGKSSLLNALLEAEAVLPTSAMRACTAVVVEISRAAAGSPYEADVEFLSREEWYKELRALLEDMKDKAGHFKKRRPDRNTEAGAAYSRVKAVYGRVDELAKLEAMQEVTQYLGTVQHIFAETAADFRTNIERFINSRTDNLREMKGGEFWPVVKCVRIRIANAEVLKTGAVLVDLPGIRDSNAARDKVAKEYLKDCNAVWVVASITRAVDDKTAREMLSVNLRRQLLMDGRYGSLAFVCTKTDSFNVTDIIRDLELQDEIQAIEHELAELENQKMQAEVEKRRLYELLQQEQQQRQGHDAADPALVQRQHEVLEKEFRISALQREKDAKLRAISLICVQARNKFSKQQIWMDFSAGLEAMMREAAYPDNEEDGDEDMEDGEFASSDSRSPGEAESQDRKLQVFTVSSTEYLKLCGKLLRDGQPQVFHDIKDTEIPALKKFAIDTALKHSMVATQKVIRDLARVLSQMVNYLTSQRAEDDSHQAQVQDIVQGSLQGLPSLLQEATDGSLQDIQNYFDLLLLATLRKGTAKAKELSEAVVRSWGSPIYGYMYPTYRAVCNRRGVYTSASPNSPCVDFNSNLAEPMYKAISVPWHEVFSSKLTVSIEGFTKAILDKLKSFFRDLKRKLSQERRLEGAIHAIGCQQMEAARARLVNFTLDLTAYVERRQRMISRVLTPEIQARMEPVYAACAQTSGPGCFRRMKEMMECYVHNEKDAVFDAAAEKLQEQLDLLQQYIRASFQSLVQELNKSLKMQFEPMLTSVQRNAKIIPELMDICAKVGKLCKRSCVDYVLPSPTQTEDSAPKVGQEPQGSLEPTSFSATFMDIRLGAVSLPHIAAIQVSRQDIGLTLADDTTVALPLRSVSHCESCLPLSCLILRTSSKAAREICLRCRVQTSNSVCSIVYAIWCAAAAAAAAALDVFDGKLGIKGLHTQEALVILDKAQDQKRFSRLIACISSSCGDPAWFQTLSLQRGREELEALGVYYTAQQPRRHDGNLELPPVAPPTLLGAVASMQPPHFPVLNLHPFGKKRAAEAIEWQLQKKCKGPATAPRAGCDPAGYALLCRTSEAKPGLHAQGSTSYSLPTTSRAFALGDGKQEALVLPGDPLHHVTVKPDVEHIAIPGSSGGVLHVRATEGIWGKGSNLNAEEEGEEEEGEGKKMEIGKETRPVDCSWMSH